MNKQQAIRWSEIRKRGKHRFVLLRRVLGWGVPTAVLWSLWMGWGEERFKQLLLSSFAIVGFPLGGYFYGRFMWNAMEKRFASFEEDEKPGN